MACKVIMITSFKGGVGKSTVAANLALQLAYFGNKTLLLDCDFRMRSLDILLGCEDYLLYDLSDVIAGRITIDKALIYDKRNENFLFCPAPYNYRDGIDGKALYDIIDNAKKTLKPDYIIIDTPGSSGQELDAVASVCDCAYIVASHGFPSIRAAECTGAELEKAGVKERRLLINMFDTTGKRSSLRPSVTEIIDDTCLQLIGIIPYDIDVPDMQDRGCLTDEKEKSNINTAFTNIANRTMGKNVPLFTDFKKIKRNKLLHI